MVRHDVRVDDAREAGSDPFDISLHGSALPGTFENYLGLSRRFRTVAGASRVAVELRELSLPTSCRQRIRFASVTTPKSSCTPMAADVKRGSRSSLHWLAAIHRKPVFFSRR